MTAPMPPNGQPPHDPRRKPPAPGAPVGSEDAGGDDDGGPGLTRADFRRGALIALGLTAAGVLLGLLWLWLAPRVPLISDGKAVYFKDSEGEEAIAADGTFVLIAAGFGLLTALAVFLLFRRGGIAVVVGTVVGALLGSIVAWRLGVWLGPTSDVPAHARAVGAGKVFEAPLQLRAKGALMIWPLMAAAAHLALTAFFGPRDPAETSPPL
ncbi:hypothetical protein ACH429_21370 [Streptomyces pathocidini]|uniref:ABC transporter permease n=1 Tax=Streptomyces pathocidini TaxID=1650571 RepID=A0ABW7UYY1_9ACTN